MSAVVRRRRVAGWVWLLLLALIGSGVFLWLRGRPAGQAAQDSGPETVAVSRGVFRVSVSGPGSLEAARTLEVKPQTSGTVLSLPQVGDRVQKGQLVARLDPADYQRALENAQLALQKAQANLDALRANQASTQAANRQSVTNAEVGYANAQRDLQSARDGLNAAQKLYDVGGASLQSLQQAKDAYAKAQAGLESARVNLETARQALSLKASSSAQDLKNAQLAVEQARLDLRNAQQNLARTKVYAPFSGVVTAVSAQLGGPAASNAALFTLVDDSRLNLPVQVDETEIGKVRVGQRAEVTLDALEGQTFRGSVTRISPSATPVQNIPVFYATVTLDNPQRLLRPGMSAEAEIIAQEVRGALTVPKRAVQTVRNRGYVEVLQPDGTRETVRVGLGPDDGVNQVITEGLEPGQLVVLPARSTSGGSSQQRQGTGFGLPVRIPAGGGR